MRHPYWRLALLLGALMTVTALGAACGDDDDSEDDATETSITPGSDDEDEDTPEATEDAGDDEEDDEATLDAIRDAAANAPDKFMAVYSVRVVDAETGEFTATFTLAADKPRELFGIEYEDGEGSGTLTVITDDEVNITCIQENDDEGSCLSTPVDSGSPFGDLTGSFFTTEDIVDELDTEGAEVRRIDGKSVAGLDSDCYEVSDAESEGTICVAKDENVITEIAGTFDGGETEFRLTEYDDDPGDDVFEPPFEVVDFGG